MLGLCTRSPPGCRCAAPGRDGKLLYLVLGVEELLDFGDVVRATVRWKRVEEGCAVAGGADAGVKQHQHAAVRE